MKIFCHLKHEAQKVQNDFFKGESSPFFANLNKGIARIVTKINLFFVNWF
jgi:CRISPR/Cas system-associated endoribonuclease Cas2